MLPVFPLPLDDLHARLPQGEALLAEAPVVRAQMANGGPDVWLALGHEAARQVLSDPRFSRAEAIKPGAPVNTLSAANPYSLTSMDPPRQTEIRRLLSRAFSPRRMERLEPRIQQMVDGLLDQFEKPTDLVQRLAEPLPVMVICELLGLPISDREQIRAWATTLVSVSASTPEEIREAFGQICAYLDDMIEDRRKHPDSALISALIRENDEHHHLTPVELTVNVQALLLAGHESTVNQISNVTIALFQHPEVRQALFGRPELWPRALDELMRYSTLTPGTMPRVTTEDVDLAGTLIRAGEGVIALPGVANRDPAAFPDPHQLNIRRANAASHLTFGHGSHYCIGTHLAKVELHAALGSLFTRFPKLAPAVPLEELRWKQGLVVRAVEALPVTW
ncbi:cytochrome P450 [Streptomyces sp. NPDC005125]